MRYRGIWSSRIGLGLFVVSSIYWVFRLINSTSHSPFAEVAPLILFQEGLNLAIALIVGVITALVKRSLSFGGIVLIGTFYGLTAGGTVGLAIILAITANIDESSFAGFILLPFLWLPGEIIGGVWGGLDWFLWYSRRQRRRSRGR